MLPVKAQSATAAKNPNAWNLAFASFQGNAPYFSVAAQDLSPSGVYIKPDGLKMYIVGTTNDQVRQYTLSSAWNIGSASFDGVSYSVNPQDTNPQDLFFKSDGTSMYVVGSTGDNIYQYNLSVAWDVSTSNYVGAFNVSGETAAPVGLFFRPDGTKMYVSGESSVFQYGLSTPWDVGTASYESSASSGDSFTPGVSFKTDGTKMYVINGNADQIRQFSLSTAWSLATASDDGVVFSVTNQESNPTGLFFKSDGTSFYVLGVSNDTIFQYTIGTAWNLSTAAYTGTDWDYVGNQQTSPTGLFFKSDGTKMYVVGSTPTVGVFQYSLATAWNVDTATYDSVSFATSGQDSNPSSVAFKSDGSSMYVVGNATDTIYQYTLGTPWAVNTASYASKSFSFAGQDGSPLGVYFKPDGAKMYMVGANNDTVYQYSLSTPWDVSTASYDSKSFSVAAQATNPTGIFFRDDGTRFFISNTTNSTVYQYTMSTAWDVSTASLTAGNLPVTIQAREPQDIFFRPNGEKMYLATAIYDAVVEYQVG